MSSEECGTRAAAIPFDARARSEDGDAAVGERICRASLGHQQRRARIPLQVLGVLGESADEEDWVSVVKGDGHERAVGITLRLHGQGAQGPGRDLGDQCSRALRVRGCRDIDVVQRLRRVTCRPGVCIFGHGPRMGLNDRGQLRGLSPQHVAKTQRTPADLLALAGQRRPSLEA
jgi:hypothetical protein